MTVYQTPAKIMVYALMELTLIHVNVSQGLLGLIVKQVREMILIFQVYKLMAGYKKANAFHNKATHLDVVMKQNWCYYSWSMWSKLVLFR